MSKDGACDAAVTMRGCGIPGFSLVYPTHAKAPWVIVPYLSGIHRPESSPWQPYETRIISMNGCNPAYGIPWQFSVSFICNQCRKYALSNYITRKKWSQRFEYPNHFTANDRKRDTAHQIYRDINHVIFVLQWYLVYSSLKYLTMIKYPYVCCLLFQLHHLSIGVKVCAPIFSSYALSTLQISHNCAMCYEIETKDNANSVKCNEIQQNMRSTNRWIPL